MIRRVGEPVKRDIRYTQRPGAYAVLQHGGMLLLTRQSEPVPEIQLPGGGVDPGEHPVAALHREVLEETGYTMKIRRRIDVFRRFTFMPEYDLWAEKICAIYLGRPGIRRGPPTEIGHASLWVSADRAARALGNPVDQFVVRSLL